MYIIDFNKPISIHFIGIGGISMSGLAEIMNHRGFKITGSDRTKSKVTTHLEDLGIKVFYEHSVSNITNDIDLVVHTAAIKHDNPELLAAIEAGIPVLDRASFLGQLMTEYDECVAISGTHGKTTTTSMLSLMLIEGEFDPTITVGGMLDSIDGNIRIGSSEHFVLEACEYTDSFLKFNPIHEIILNIEADHLDYFKDLDHIRSSFKQFALKVPQGGNLVINCDIENYNELFKEVQGNITTFGTEESKNNKSADFLAKNISYNNFGCASFDLFEKNKFIGNIELSVIGKYNIENALAASVMALKLGVPFDKIRKALTNFHSVGRRFEYKGKVNGINIFDDYAHHPTEIANLLTAAKRYPHKNLWCVFQPHTFSRSIALFDDFVKSLALADKIILADIYSAREIDKGEISSLDFVNALKNDYQKEAYYFPSFEEINKFILEKCCDGDMLITTGAGNVVNIANMLTNK